MLDEVQHNLNGVQGELEKIQESKASDADIIIQESLQAQEQLSAIQTKLEYFEHLITTVENEPLPESLKEQAERINKLRQQAEQLQTELVKKQQSLEGMISKVQDAAKYKNILDEVLNGISQCQKKAQSLAAETQPLSNDSNELTGQVEQARKTVEEVGGLETAIKQYQSMIEGTKQNEADLGEPAAGLSGQRAAAEARLNALVQEVGAAKKRAEANLKQAQEALTKLKAEQAEANEPEQTIEEDPAQKLKEYYTRVEDLYRKLYEKLNTKQPEDKQAIEDFAEECYELGVSIAKEQEAEEELYKKALNAASSDEAKKGLADLKQNFNNIKSGYEFAAQALSIKLEADIIAANKDEQERTAAIQQQALQVSYNKAKLEQRYNKELNADQQQTEHVKAAKKIAEDCLENYKQHLVAEPKKSSIPVNPIPAPDPASPGLTMTRTAQGQTLGAEAQPLTIEASPENSATTAATGKSSQADPTDDFDLRKIVKAYIEDVNSPDLRYRQDKDGIGKVQAGSAANPKTIIEVHKNSMIAYGNTAYQHLLKIAAENTNIAYCYRGSDAKLKAILTVFEQQINAETDVNRKALLQTAFEKARFLPEGQSEKISITDYKARLAEQASPSLKK